MTIAGEASRNDHAVLMACTKAPNYRVNVVHRLQESLSAGKESTFLSTQQFAEEPAEEGWKHLSFMEVDGLPRWDFDWQGIRVEKKMAMVHGENTVAVHIRRIREKIEIDPKNPRYLKVVWGIGYKIEKF